jgi:hypothetical protein
LCSPSAPLYATLTGNGDTLNAEVATLKDQVKTLTISNTARRRTLASLR